MDADDNPILDYVQPKPGTVTKGGVFAENVGPAGPEGPAGPAGAEGKEGKEPPNNSNIKNQTGEEQAASFNIAGSGSINGFFTIKTTLSTSETSARVIRFEPTLIGSGGSPGGINILPVFEPSASPGNCYGVIQVANANPPIGVTITTAISGRYQCNTGSGGGTVTESNGLAVTTPSLGSIKPTTIVGLSVQNQGVTGVTTSVGIDVKETKNATANINVRIAKGGTYALQLSDTGGAASGGITWGTDTTLYRSAAKTLKTDGNLKVGEALEHLGASLGFYNTAGIAKPKVTGAKAGNAALTSLVEKLAALGLITNETT